MRYLCLIYGDEKWWDQASEAEKQQGMAEYNAFTENVKKNGNYVGGEALQPTNTAKSVRVRRSRSRFSYRSVGPLASTSPK